ncbi:zinc finger BED domain-containing protein RICESLEEPER 2-like protein [Tanacetum coccineum]|uniref:Zinc finger BED domain-containing protein RICESLEEPER 2-like protein n=1 Tax=Tanacetum coccineum TaxID=301880 RepID=A0ABQ4YEW6_9ASTR
MVIVDELPFCFVEREGFRHYSKINQPLFDVPCRVQDGTKVVDKSIENIRYAVKWIKKSGSRIEKFKSCAESAKCDITKNLILDVPTRWNSTYNVLEVAQAYEDAFDRYDLEDVTFGNAIRKKGLSVLTSEDWDKARKLCGFLKMFYDVTLRISKTKYVTSHTLVVELSTIREIYPRNKDEFLHIVVNDHYGMEGLAMVELKKSYIHAQFKALYQDYVRIHAPTSTSSSMLGKRSNMDDKTTNPPARDRLRDKMKKSSTSTSTISEVDNDLLAIPVSTVASESVFSTSGRVLDTFRSSLSDKSIKSLICTQDWLRKDKDRIPKKKEDCEAIIIVEDEGRAIKRDVIGDESFFYCRSKKFLKVVLFRDYKLIVEL